MSSSYVTALIAEITAYGVSEYAVEPGGKHPHLVFRYEGQRLTYPFPATPSDHRGIHNALSDLRRLMGVRRQVRKTTRQRPHRQKGGGSSGAPAAPMPMTFTIKPNPFDQLALRLAQLNAAARPTASASLTGG